MSDTIKKIRLVAKEAADKKFNEERKKLEDKSKEDLAILDKILKMVKDGFIYKTIGESWSKKYIVVTEDIVFEDYTNPPKGYNSGKTGVFKQNASYYQIGDVLNIYVNGHVYYHAQDIFRRYEEELKKTMEKFEQEREIISRKQDGLKALKELEPAVKMIMLNHQKHSNNIETVD